MALVRRPASAGLDNESRVARHRTLNPSTHLRSPRVRESAPRSRVRRLGGGSSHLEAYTRFPVGQTPLPPCLASKVRGIRRGDRPTVAGLEDSHALEDEPQSGHLDGGASGPLCWRTCEPPVSALGCCQPTGASSCGHVAHFDPWVPMAISCGPSRGSEFGNQWTKPARKTAYGRWGPTVGSPRRSIVRLVPVKRSTSTISIGLPPPASSVLVRRRMRNVRRRDTPAELALRKELHALGLRYRVDARPLKDVARRADVVFRRSRVAVFVDGCFWHSCPVHGRIPKTNSEWWAAKLEVTRRRDEDTVVHLQRAGWMVVRMWEHDDPRPVAKRIFRLVRSRAPATAQ